MDKWLRESEESLNEAEKVAARGDVPLENLYMLAPLIYSQRQNMNNEALLARMINKCEKLVSQDFEIDEHSKSQYKFHYVSSYLYCLVVAGRFDEKQYDDVMEYVCGNMTLFTKDYVQRQST